MARKEKDSDVLERMLGRFEKKKEPHNIEWKQLYYSLFEDV